MERKFESRTKNKAGLLRMACEGFLSNLPILVCGLAVGLALAGDMFGS